MKFWITVRRATVGAPSGAEGDLWVREIGVNVMPQVTRPGQRAQVQLSAPGDPDREGGPIADIKRTYIDSADGEINVELIDYLVDPDEKMRERIVQRLVEGVGTITPWFTRTDGEPEEMLTRCGFTRYT